MTILFQSVVGVIGIVGNILTILVLSTKVSMVTILIFSGCPQDALEVMLVCSLRRFIAGDAEKDDDEDNYDIVFHRTLWGLNTS